MYRSRLLGSRVHGWEFGVRVPPVAQLRISRGLGRLDRPREHARVEVRFAQRYSLDRLSYPDFGFWVSGFGFRVSGFGLSDFGSGLSVSCSVFSVECAGCSVVFGIE